MSTILYCQYIYPKKYLLDVVFSGGMVDLSSSDPIPDSPSVQVEVDIMLSFTTKRSLSLTHENLQQLSDFLLLGVFSVSVIIVLSIFFKKEIAAEDEEYGSV